ncbi:MAG: glycosyltransferase [Candidatus Pacearchaeota archaeon]
MRIAIFEPSRKFVGGGQKVIAKIAEYLSKENDVELFTQRYPQEDLDFGKTKITLIKPKTSFLAPIAFLLKKVRGFDIVILGGFPANLGSIRNKNCVTICYSPTRVFYDLRDHLIRNSNSIDKLKIIIKNIFLKKIDFLASQKTKKIFAISKTSQKRIKKYYKRDSMIIYPGVDIKKFKTGKYGNYILSVARLVSAKRVDVLVKSMDYIKNKKIKMYIVGDGREKENIKKLASRNSNIKLIDYANDSELIELYSNCLAVAYIPINEDFGLVPVEAGASGRATIGADEGGLRETIINGKTGFLIKKVTPKNIAEKIDYFINNRNFAKKMGENAREHIKKFDWKIILEEFDKNLRRVFK